MAWREVEACLFMYETFKAHLIENVKALFAKGDTNLAVISGRFTSVLQPLVFHEKRNSWIQMMADCIHDFTVIDHAKNPSEE